MTTLATRLRRLLPASLLLSFLLLIGCDPGPSTGTPPTGTPPQNPPVIGVSVGSLSFTAQEGASPASQALTITNTGEGTLSWSASPSSNWLGVSASSGSLAAGASASLTVSLNTSGMSSGTYTSTIALSAPGAKEGSKSVTVTLTLTPAPALQVSAASLSFSAQQGASPSNQTFTVSNPGGGTLAWSASENLGWLSVSPAGGNLAAGASVAVTVSVNTAGLASGAYSGVIELSAPGAKDSPRSVAVTLAVAAPPALTVTPPSLTFTAQQGANPAGQAVTISNTGGGTLEWTASEPIPWLVGSPASGSLAAGQSAALNLSVNTAGLSVGTYTGTITVTAPGATSSPRTVDVTLTITAQPALGVSPASLTFTAEQGTNPVGQAVTISNIGTGTLSWTASEPIPWLVGSPGSGSLAAGQSASLNLSVNTAGLAAGTYNGTITVTAPGAANSPRTVDVILTVTSQPALGVSPASLSFTAEQGSNPAAQALTLSNEGTGTLNWTASEPIPWLIGSPASGSLGAGQSAQLNLSVNTAGLAAGTYSGTITITAPGAANSPQSIAVSLTVTAPSAAPVLDVNPGSLSFTTAQGGNPAGQSLTISNTGTGTLAWAASEPMPWLVGSPASGSLAAGQSTLLNLSVNTTGLSAGTYTGTVTVTAPGAAGSPRNVQVTLTISATPRPILRIDGGTSSTRAIGETFVTTGSGFTPNQSVTRYLRDPNGNLITLTPLLTADGSGNIGWSFTPVCTTPLGTGKLWARDDATGQVSDSVTQVVTASSTCNPTLLPAPALSSPGNGTTGVSVNPTFAWSAVTGANRYWLMVATDPSAFPTDPSATSCPGCVISGNTGSTSYTPTAVFPYNGKTVSLNPNTHYYWKVQAWNTDGRQGSYPSPFNFTTAAVTPPTLLPAPALSSPGNGAAGVSVNPTFTWSAVSGANRYWLMVATSLTTFPTDPDATSCPACVISGNTGSTSYTPTAVFPYNGKTVSLNPNTHYYWKVQAWNTDGRQGSYPAASNFTTAAVTPPPLACPSGWNSFAGNGAILCWQSRALSGGTEVQYVVQMDLTQGGRIMSLHHALSDFSSANRSPKFELQTVSHWWTNYGPHADWFCLVNGVPFMDLQKPGTSDTELSFPLRNDGNLVTTGAEMSTTKVKSALLLYPDRAEIADYSLGATAELRLINGALLSPLAAVSLNRNYGDDSAHGQTFVAVKDANADGVNETVLFYVTLKATRSEVNQILKDVFHVSSTGAMQLDGGQSSQIRCSNGINVYGKDLNLFARPVPQVFLLLHRVP